MVTCSRWQMLKESFSQLWSQWVTCSLLLLLVWLRRSPCRFRWRTKPSSSKTRCTKFKNSWIPSTWIKLSSVVLSSTLHTSTNRSTIRTCLCTMIWLDIYLTNWEKKWYTSQAKGFSPACSASIVQKISFASWPAYCRASYSYQVTISSTKKTSVTKCISLLKVQFMCSPMTSRLSSLRSARAATSVKSLSCWRPKGLRTYRQKRFASSTFWRRRISTPSLVIFLKSRSSW